MIWYEQIGHEEAQSVIDSITNSYAAEGQTISFPPGANQAGGPAGFPGFPGMMPPFPPGGMPPGISHPRDWNDRFTLYGILIDAN